MDKQAKRPRGRPRIQQGGDAQRVQLTLDDETIAKAKLIGPSLSGAVRTAVKQYKK